MKCNACGFENTEGATICESCKASLTVSPSEEKNEAPNQNKSKKTKGAKESLAALIVPICAVLLIAITLFLIVRTVVDYTDIPEIKDYYISLYDRENDRTYFLFNGRLVDGYAIGKCTEPQNEESISEDGTVAAVLGKTQDGHILSVLTPSGIHMISDSVNDETCRFFVSDNGRYVVYMLKKEGVLYIYDVSSREIRITPDFGVSEFSFASNESEILILSSNKKLAAFDVSTLKGKTLAENVKEYFILEDGAKILYLTEENKLCLYTKWSTSTEEISENAISVALSNDEEAFAYTVLANKEETKNGVYVVSNCYFRRGQKDTLIGNNIEAVALDGKGEYIYCRNSSGILFLTSLDGNEEILFEDCKEFSLSKDLNEIAYSTDEGTYIYTQENGKTKLFTTENAKPLISEDEENNIKSFKNRFWSEEDEGETTLFYLGEELELIKLVENAEKYILSEEGSILFAESDGKIFAAERKQNSKAEELCEGSLEDGKYFITGEKSELYLVESGEDGLSLLYWCESGEKKLISENVFGRVKMSHDKNIFFTEKGKEDEETNISSSEKPNLSLFGTKSGSEKTLLLENVLMIKISKAASYVITPGENQTNEKKAFSVYGCTGGSNFKLLVDDLEIEGE